jgi:hypothetical protein
MLSFLFSFEPYWPSLSFCNEYTISRLETSSSIYLESTSCPPSRVNTVERQRRCIQPRSEIVWSAFWTFLPNRLPEQWLESACCEIRECPRESSGQPPLDPGDFPHNIRHVIWYDVKQYDTYHLPRCCHHLLLCQLDNGLFAFHVKLLHPDSLYDSEEFTSRHQLWLALEPEQLILRSMYYQEYLWYVRDTAPAPFWTACDAVTTERRVAWAMLGHARLGADSKSWESALCAEVLAAVGVKIWADQEQAKYARRIRMLTDEEVEDEERRWWKAVEEDDILYWHMEWYMEQKKYQMWWEEEYTEDGRSRWPASLQVGEGARKLARKIDRARKARRQAARAAAHRMAGAASGAVKRPGPARARAVLAGGRGSAGPAGRGGKSRWDPDGGPGASSF